MQINLENVNIKIDGGKAVLDLTEAQLAQLIGQQEKPLSDFSPGDKISIAGFDFIVLEHDSDGTTVIFKDILLSRKFDSESNNWIGSDLREWLYNNDFYETIKNELGLSAIIGMTRDLTSMDGLTDYGSIQDYISLLTFDEYRKYHTILGLNPKYSDWWWLLTPASTPSNGYSRGVCCVSDRGIPSWGTCSYGNGVRPVLKLKSFILIKPKNEQ